MYDKWRTISLHCMKRLLPRDPMDLCVLVALLLSLGHGIFSEVTNPMVLWHVQTLLLVAIYGRLTERNRSGL